MKIDLEPYVPIERVGLWCNRCDMNVVDSTNDETGHFFVQFGHAFDGLTKRYDGDYVGIMFAFCKDCESRMDVV